MESGGGEELDSHNPRRNPSSRDSAANMGGGGGSNYDTQLPRAMSNRTLLDIIREEGGGSKESKKTWRHFKDKLHRSRSNGRGSTWTSTVPVPTSDIPINNSKNWMISRHPSTRINSGLESNPTSQPDISAAPDAPSSLLRNSSRSMDQRASGRFNHTGPSPMRRLQMEEEEEEEDEKEESEEHSDASEKEREREKEAAGEEEQRPVRMSLMSLLAEYGMDEDEDDDEEEEDGGAVEYNNCCICMVRHKGTAFEPCGHSFCRLCSREMWVQGGNCPLCNNYILEILDIF